MNYPFVYNVDLDDERKLILVSFNGLINKASASVGKEMREKAAKMGYGLILNFSNCDIEVSLLEAHLWLKENNYNSNHYQVPTVHVYKPKYEEFFSFLRDSWINQGANCSSATSLKKAYILLDKLKNHQFS